MNTKDEKHRRLRERERASILDVLGFWLAKIEPCDDEQTTSQLRERRRTLGFGPCRFCEGTGWVGAEFASEPCEHCKGTGYDRS